MSEVLFLTAVVLLLVGAMGFYFYSRVAYTDRKINLLESVLLDIKMHMDMEAPVYTPPPMKEPEPFEPEDSEELKATEAMYSSVIHEAAMGVVEEATAKVDYESMSREELSTIAQTRSLRVTKAMKKGAIVTMLRDLDKNTSLPSIMDGGLDKPEMGSSISLDHPMELPVESLSQ